MASYIQGLTDYIPQIQPFKPDLNFYATVLQKKQSDYDAAQKKLGSLYGTLLNSPLSRTDNIKRRDEFFKMIEQDIKKVSSMDLSLPQNQDIAASVFDPLIKDKAITHDMNFTKSISDEIQRGELYRNCVDKSKCNGEYWKEGIAALNFQLSDYAKASKEDALKMSPGKYTPFINVTEKALKWAKDMDLVVEAATNTGQYIVKQQNGAKLQVPLMSMFMSVFGQDPAIKEMYNTKAYLNRKAYIEQNKTKYGGDENKAEDAYFNEVMSGTIKKLEEDAKEHKDIKTKVTTRRQAITNDIKKNGITLGDPLFNDWYNSAEEEKISTEVSTYYDKLKDKITGLPNVVGDRQAMRSMIEGFVSDGYLKEELGMAAYDFARSHNEITDISANPYALAAYNSQLNIQEKMVQFDLDIQKAIKLAEIDISKDMAKGMLNGGFPTDYEGMVEAGGAGQSTAGGADMFSMTEAERKAAGVSMLGKQKEYVNNTISFLKAQAGDPNADPASRQLAKNELKNLMGNLYDDATNSFVKDGVKYNNYNDLQLGPKNVNYLYMNSKTVIGRNQNLFKNLAAKNAAIAEEYDQFNLLRSGYANTIFNNNALVKNHAKASVEVEDKYMFDNLFDKVSDGKYAVITNENDYVKKMMPKINYGKSNKDKEEYLRKSYRENYSLYKEIYSGGKISGIQSPYGMGLGNNIDGGMYANKISWNVDYNVPAKFGNQGLISFYKNAMMAGDGAYKAIFGTNHTDEDYAAKQTSEAGAKSIMNAFVSDLNSSRYTTKEQGFKAPSAKISYADVAANNGNLVALELSNINPEWLKSKAVGKKGQETVFGVPMAKVMEEGLTIFMDKGAANNIITNQYKVKAGDAYLNSGLTYSISRPNAGSVNLRKMGNQLVAEGSLFGYDGEGKRQSMNITQTFDGMLSGDALIKEFTRLYNEQEKMNINFLQNGPLPRMYDEATLYKTISQGAAQNMSPGAQGITERLNYFRSQLGM